MAAGCPGAERTNPTGARRSVSRRLAYLVALVLCLPSGLHAQPSIEGFRPRDVGLSTQDGVFVLTVGTNHTLLLFGEQLTNETVVRYTDSQVGCQAATSDLFGRSRVSVGANGPPSATAYFDRSYAAVYFCLFGSEAQTEGQHQGIEDWRRFAVVEGTESSGSGSSGRLLPLPVEITFIFVLIILSGLFSGLNLGLMALDPTTLKIIMESGTKRQRGYAKKIFRVRKRGNYLLCTLLLGNVLVNSTLTVLLDQVLGSGVYAVVSSTIVIVIFGEIVPQAICSRYGLFIGANTIYLTYIFMVLTFPLSFPISMILNCILGKEIGAVYNREQLLELLKVTEGHHGIAKDEVDIISGALEFKKKTAEEVMTNYGDVYCLDINSVLDFKTMRDIFESGFSRIPVYEGDRHNIVGLLYLRDLAFVDADDETPLSTVVNFYSHEVRYVFNDSKLDEILTQFSEGKCHMAIVKSVVTETEGDPFYEVVGVVTLEDIVEEILQREIVDETDRFMDNRSLKPRERKQKFDLDEFVDTPETNLLSSQQRLAIYQFLCTGVEPFRESHMSQTVLKRLLQKNIVSFVSLEESRRKDYCLYKAGCPANYFTLVLEGCVQVVIGREQLEFESRSFSYFGAEALLCSSNDTGQDHPYIPDFTARAVTDCQLLIVTRSQYTAACNATQFERRIHLLEGSRNESKSDVFAREWERAETQDSRPFGGVSSGLPPIASKAPKWPASKRGGVTKQVSVEHRPLLNGHGASSVSHSGMSESTDEESPPLRRRRRDPYAMEMGVLDPNHFSSGGRTGTSDITSASSNPHHSPVLQLDRQDLLGGAAEGELQALNHLPLEPLHHHGNSNHMLPSGSGNLMPQAVSHIRTSTSPTLDSQTSSNT